MAKSYSNDTIKNRSILTVGIVMVFISSVFLLAGLYMHYRYISNSIVNDSIQAQHAYSDAEKHGYQKYIEVAEKTAGSPEVLKAFSQGDRQRLLELSQDIFKKLNFHDQFLHLMHFHTPDNYSFLRIHSISNYGDNLSAIRPMIVAANSTKSVKTGFEIGRFGAYYRIAVPVKYEGKYLGVLEFGLNPLFIADSMQTFGGLRSSIVINKKYIRSEAIEKNYSESDNFAIIGRDGKLISQAIEDDVLTENFKIKNINDKYYSFSATNEIKSFDGKTIARIITMRDITSDVSEIFKTAAALSLIVAACVIFALISLNYSFSAIIGRIYKGERKLRLRKSQDRLTRLPNRFALMDDLENDCGSSLILINIDRFKDINDLLGLNAGDSILKEYAMVLRRYINEVSELYPDTIHKKRIYRLGRDEFVLLFKHVEGMERVVAEYISSKTDSETLHYRDVELTVSVTLGISISENKKLQCADRALKKAKSKKYKYTIVDCDGKLENRHENNINVFTQVKNAVKENRIIPYFQPISDNLNGSIKKYECLVRLVENDGTVVSPAQFLPFIKNTRIYPEITKIMIEKSINTFKDLDIEFSINISAEDILNREIVEFLKEKMMVMKDTSKLILEILESENIENYDEVRDFIKEVKKLGCKIAIDDFGTGYSNFQHLLNLEIDYLKIDGEIIKNTNMNHNSKQLIKTIVSLAAEIKVQTIAEFVCDKDIYETCKEIGLDFSQGYYISEPLKKVV